MALFIIYARQCQFWSLISKWHLQNVGGSSALKGEVWPLDFVTLNIFVVKNIDIIAKYKDLEQIPFGQIGFWSLWTDRMHGVWQSASHLFAIQ